MTSSWSLVHPLRTYVCFVTSFIILAAMMDFCSATAAPTNSIKVDGKTLFESLMASRCSVSCVTTRVRPVCGTNDVTYASRCELKRAKKCEKLRIKVKHRGKCARDAGPPSKCLLERREATSGVRPSGEHVPSCKPDGSYNEIQCHPPSGYCWCVTRDGRHISRTSVRGRRPRCKGKRKGRSDKGQRKRRCTNKDRQTFNTALIKVFKEEYLRVHPTPRPADENAEEFGTEKSIVLWKFDELDLNKDGKLKFKEIRNFGRMVKKLIQPKGCARRFVRYCDKRKDRRIEKAEWTLCLGVDIKLSFRMFISLNSAGHKKGSPTPGLSGGHRPIVPILNFPKPGRLPLPSNPFSAAQSLPVLTSSDTSRGQSRSNSADRKDVSLSCAEEQRAALKYHSEEPDAKPFIPACTPAGLWEKAQCHKSRGYCWCVKENTGKPIPGTATYKVIPDCNFKNERPMKGCPFEQKRKFLVDLMGDLTEERKKSLGNHSNQTQGPEKNLSLRETVARWKLKSLDTNNNGMLERKEWKPMRRSTLKNRRYPRKCRRNFIRYCDEDENKRITHEEWKACLGLNGNNNFNTLPINPKRTGSNPFVEQLT